MEFLGVQTLCLASTTSCLESKTSLVLWALNSWKKKENLSHVNGIHHGLMKYSLRQGHEESMTFWYAVGPGLFYIGLSLFRDPKQAQVGLLNLGPMPFTLNH